MKVNQNVLRFVLGYLGGELNQACVRNGTGAESESLYNIIKVEQIITSVRAKFIHNLRKGRLPTEFDSFASSVNLDDENNRSSRFSMFNYNQIKDKSTPKYHIIKSWNNLPFEVKSAQPDDFLDQLKLYFNSCNEQPCQIDGCWLCS